MAHALSLTASSTGRAPVPTGDGSTLLVDDANAVMITVAPKPSAWDPEGLALFRGGQRVATPPMSDGTRWVLMGDDRFGSFQARATAAGTPVESPAVRVVPATVSLRQPPAPAPRARAPAASPPAPAPSSTFTLRSVTVGRVTVRRVTRDRSACRGYRRCCRWPGGSGSAAPPLPRLSRLLRLRRWPRPSSPAYPSPAASAASVLAAGPATAPVRIGPPLRVPLQRAMPVPVWHPHPPRPRLPARSPFLPCPQLRRSPAGPGRPRPTSGPRPPPPTRSPHPCHTGRGRGTARGVRRSVRRGRRGHLLATRPHRPGDRGDAGHQRPHHRDPDPPGHPTPPTPTRRRARLGRRQRCSSPSGCILLLAAAALAALDVRGRQRRDSATPTALRGTQATLDKAPGILENPGKFRGTLALLITGVVVVLIGFLGQVHWS